MLIRMFGVFGLLLASAYLSEAMSLVRAVPNDLNRNALAEFGLQVIFVSLDLFFGISLIIAGIGLLFLKEWARKAWLIFVSALVLIHFSVIALTVTGGGVADPSYSIWTGMVVLITVLSWWYFTKSFVRSRFSTAK